jgi:hypothetical protein
MEIGKIERTIYLFNTCFEVGTRVVYFPRCYDDGTLIHKDCKRSYTKSKAFVDENNNVVVELEGIGNCDVRYVVGAAACSVAADSFDETFEHRW